MPRPMVIVISLALAIGAFSIIWLIKPSSPDRLAQNGSIPVVIPGSSQNAEDASGNGAGLDRTSDTGSNMIVGSPSGATETALPANFDVRNATQEQLGQLFKNQTRDPQWAPQAEAGLRNQMAPTPVFGASSKVSCGTTICEITGQARQGASAAESDAAMAALQGGDTDSAIGRLGFTPGGPISFGVNKSSPGVVTFTKYVVRESR